MVDGNAEDQWLLAPAERELVMTKNRANRLGFAILLTFFRERGRFPRDEAEVERQGMSALSRQLDVPAPIDGEAFLTGRTAERLRAEIRVRFGFREATVVDAEMLTEWLRDHVASEVGGEIVPMIERLEARCRELAIEPPTPERMERLARSALRAHEDRFHKSVFERLPPPTRERLDALLRPEKTDSEESATDAQGEAAGSAPAVLLKLRGSPGRPGLASMRDELEKLELIRGIELPADLFDQASSRDLERCRQRVSVEVPRDLRRHPDAARLTWLAAFVHLRARSLTDDLVDLLIETIHQIGARAERKVERELLEDLKRVSGKQNLLFNLADATLAQPDGVVRDVVFPVVGEQTLRDLVKEWKATGPTYRITLRTVIRNSYQGHYRRIVPTLLAFAFCRLLGFQLLPRLKAIHSQKLYRPETGKADAYANLQQILTKPIDWDSVRQQYDQMVKYATALRLGTADTEAILRRFTKKNVQHPTYKAFAELGKAIKTIFLCRYLHDEALRREINEGLNVVEQWNGATDFVFFARRGEMASNRREDHEVSMLALHLIQNCMVYINTLMIQKVLALPQWQGRFTPRDYAALTPLIWEHVNPYGRFDLDMNTRLDLP